MFRFAASVMPAFLRRAGLVALACSALTLVGCGGGNRAKDYNPDSIVIFGDENSAFATHSIPGISYTVRGLVYTVNPVTTYTLSPANVATDTYKICTDVLTPTTLCTTNILTNANTTVGGFVITGADAVNFPYGQVDRQGLGTGTNDFNIVNFIAVGTGNVTVGSASTPTNTPMKRSTALFYNCNASSTWMQVLAHSFNKGFKQSNVDAGCAIDRDGAVSYATANATIASVQTQVSNNMSSLRGGVLVGVLAGQQDILDVWRGNVTWGTQDAKLREVKYRADQLARVVKQILGTGAKVVLIGVPDLGFAPEFAAASGASRCALIADTRSDGSPAPACNGDLQALVAAFNETVMLGDTGLRLDGLQDYASQGRKLAFVDGRVFVQDYAMSASYVNARVCEPSTTDATKHLMFSPDGANNTTSAVQYCTGLSLVSGGDVSTYIWADGTHLSWPVHGAIGSAAFAQATRQF